MLLVMSSCGGSGSADCSAEMKSFMGALKGKADDVSSALGQYGAEGLDRKDMDMYDLQDPTCTACEKKDGKEICTMEAKAGMTVRTYVLTWEGGKITSVEDKGMK